MNHKHFIRMFLFAFVASPLFASAEQTQPMEEVIVTGSLIKGTPLDAALPVEVYGAAELQDLGSPTALEFVKSLTVSGPSTGSSHYFSGAQLGGDVGVNLRGLGADKTLTLMNGRRLGGNTTSAVAGGSANINMLPGMAFQRIEILKDGAAVTYGADATGGVVNYITYEGFTGVEVATSYKNYGADGDWNLGLLTGFGEGDTNVIIAAEWDHRSELDTKERSFARGNYAANPAPWSTLTNLAGWTARSPFGPVDSPDDLTWGGVVGLATDFTPDSCNAVGGIYRDVFTCKYNYIPYYNLVEESDTYRLYLQVNSQISDNDNFHMQLAWARVHTPHATGSPAQPVIRGPATNQGATYQFFVPMANPYVDEFVTRTGFAASPFFGITSGFTPITYRAFAHGGNSTLGVNGNFGAPSEIDNRYMHFSTGVDGLVFDTEISYDVAFTFNHQSEYNDFPDVIGSRLQEALNGFGGANCAAADLDPTQFGTQNPAAAGTGSCQWWNPFASGWAGQPILGLSNPNHVPGTENPDDLARWIFNERAGQNILWNATVDAVVSGQLGLELGGGPVAWALGTQWRTTKLRESVPDPLFNGNQPCAWPGQDPADPDDPSFTGCTEDRPGPFVFFDTNIPESQAQDQESYFLELNLPILDNLYMVAAARYEQFQPVDLDATVYKVSLKFDATDNLSFRGSYGTNYQAPGLGITPGEITNGVNSYTIAAGNWRGAQVITESGIEPETAKVWNTGLVWQSEGYGDESDVYLSLDYWNIETEDELGLLASANDVANAVFSIAPGGGGVPLDGSALADCSHPMVGRVTFNSGACVQGVTAADDFSNITTAYGNGPGQLTSGVDMRVRYRIPAFGGDLGLTLQVTRILEFESTPTILDGVELVPADDRLGYLNFATIAFAASEWRANFDVNWRYDIHNIRGRMNFVSSVVDDRFVDKATGVVNEAALIPEGFQPGTATAFEPSFYGVFPDDWISFDLHYTADFSWAMFTASIINITDEDPPESRQELGYDPRIGNPLGRQFEVGLRKTF